jgi:hypothetical protein
MNKSKLWSMAIALVAAFLLCSHPSYCDSSPTLALDPVGGALSGAAGTTVGWGFTITTNSENFLLVTSSDFCTGAMSSPCSNSLGIYTDFIGSDQFIVVGPAPESSSVSQAFDLLALTGVGSFAINAGAFAGETVDGQIILTYDLFSQDPNDPNFDPLTSTLVVGGLLTADASVTVPVSAIPEPGTFGLLGIGLSAMAVIKIKRKEPA